MLYPLSYEGGDGAERGAKLGATARKPWGKGSSGVLGRSKLSDGYAHQVARVVPSDARAFHPAGLTDPSGFVAMSLDGLLVHTSDVVKAPGGAFQLSDDLVVAVLAVCGLLASGELLPREALLWGNGRMALRGYANPASWPIRPSGRVVGLPMGKPAPNPVDQRSPKGMDPESRLLDGRPLAL